MNRRFPATETVLERFPSDPPTNDRGRVAVIGAGVAGATVARSLSDLGIPVDVLEKSRGSGGRCSTRRTTDGSDRPLHFDHGAQYFTARTSAFRSLIEHGRREEWIEEWNPRLAVYEDGQTQPKETSTRRYVTTPKMSTLAGNILGPVPPRFSTRIESLERSRNGWELRSASVETLGPYGTVVLTCPAPQTRQLLETADSSLIDALSGVDMRPVWSVMVSFTSSLSTDFDAAFVNEGDLDWVARNSSKPGRPDPECWVLHATADWSRQNVDQPANTVTETLIDEFRRITETDVPQPSHRDAHRWLYARTAADRDDGHVESDDGSLLVCGDWLDGSRIEGAYTSALSAVGSLVTHET